MTIEDIPAAFAQWYVALSALATALDATYLLAQRYFRTSDRIPPHYEDQILMVLDKVRGAVRVLVGGFSLLRTKR